MVKAVRQINRASRMESDLWAIRVLTLHPLRHAHSGGRDGSALPRLPDVGRPRGASTTQTVSMAPGQSPSRREPTEFPCEFGGYRLRGLLGRGGMGTVYDAEQIATARRVALKMLGQGLDSPEMRQRFLREGRLAAGVSHPNSLYVFGSEEIEGVPVITMEIAGSGTLKDKLKRRGPLPVTEAVDAMLDVIAGLEAAFAAGVLHRDVKPSNCFVTPDGSVKIGDFGLSVSTLAKEDSYVTATGVIMGTPAYASPEQLRGDNLDVRADIYSVGARSSPCSPTGRPSRATTRCRWSPTPSTSNRNR